MSHDDAIHITIPGSAADPRDADVPDGVVIHRVPHLHPDDVTSINGVPVTSVARTLVDLAEEMAKAELIATFRRAQQLELLDLDAVRASARRVEWRPSLALLHQVIDELAGEADAGPEATG